MLIGGVPLGFSVGGCVLDALTTSVPEVAYSLRRLTASYKGKCINVRRSSDNTAMDIGFVGNRLDTSTLLLFCGTASGYVTTWYNQGTLGSVVNATQGNASYQPRIVNAGALDAQGGLPAMYFGWTTNPCFLNLPAAAAPTGTAAVTVNLVMSYISKPNTIVPFSVGADVTNECVYVLFSASATNYTITSLSSGSVSGGTVSSGAQFIETGIFASTAYLYINGANVGSSPMTVSIVAGQNRIGQGLSSGYWSGYMQEIIQPLLALSTTDRQTIEHNQESYYGITGV